MPEEIKLHSKRNRNLKINKSDNRSTLIYIKTCHNEKCVQTFS